MTNIRPKDLPARASVSPLSAIIFDDGAGVWKGTPAQVLIGAGGITSAALGAPTGSSMSGFLQSGTGAQTRNALQKMRDHVNLADFLPSGYVIDGSVAYTAQWQEAIDAASTQTSSRKLIVPAGLWKVGSTLDLGSKNITIEGDGYLDQPPHVIGNFDGFIFDASGTNLLFSLPVSFSGLKIENQHNGASAGSAGCVNIQYTGLVKFRDCILQAQNTGLLLTEAISTILDNTYIVGASGTNTTRLNNRGLLGGARNFKMFGGRIYGFAIAADISGDSLAFYGTNMEFNDIIFRTGAVSALMCASCHFETSGMILTNAVNLPTISTSPWGDNGGNGTGWSGAITFLNCQAAFDTVGSANGVTAPAFVIKTQGGFGGKLDLTGSNFVIPSSLATISSSFDRTAPTAAISGLSVRDDSTGFITPTTIPDDSSSFYLNTKPVSQGGGFQMGNVAFGTNSYTNTINRMVVRQAGSGVDLGGSTGVGTIRVRGTTTGSGIIDFYPVSLDPTASPFFKGRMIYDHTADTLSVGTNGALRTVLDAVSLRPVTDNVLALGGTSNRWTTVYAATGTINISDLNAKTDIEPTTKGLDFINALSPKTFKYKESGNVDPDTGEQIPGKRFHEGLIAQDVKSVLDGLNIDSGMWINGEGGQGLRYEELIGPLIKAVQELSAKVEALGE